MIHPDLALTVSSLPIEGSYLYRQGKIIL